MRDLGLKVRSKGGRIRRQGGRGAVAGEVQRGVGGADAEGGACQDDRLGIFLDGFFLNVGQGELGTRVFGVVAAHRLLFFFDVFYYATIGERERKSISFFLFLLFLFDNDG